MPLLSWVLDRVVAGVGGARGGDLLHEGVASDLGMKETVVLRPGIDTCEDRSLVSV